MKHKESYSLTVSFDSVVDFYDLYVKLISHGYNVVQVDETKHKREKLND